MVHRHHRTPTAEGTVYCAAVLDVFSRQVVGWSIADHMRSELVVDALEMACWRRRPTPGAIVHSDRGAQPTSWIFGDRLRAAGLLGSMGRVASSVDNTMIESFWSTMQRELLDRQHWTSRDQLASAIFEWIEALCDPIRRHSPSPTSAPPPTTPYTPPPEPRHDHHINRVREGVSSSKHPG